MGEPESAEDGRLFSLSQRERAGVREKLARAAAMSRNVKRPLHNKGSPSPSIPLPLGEGGSG